MTAEAFDLAEQLQTPVIVLTDLDLGMNDHVSAALCVGRFRSKYKRGKVLNAAMPLIRWSALAATLDTENDGIPYRTYPGNTPDERLVLHPRHLAR